jgi:hypothetical protein
LIDDVNQGSEMVVTMRSTKHSWRSAAKAKTSPITGEETPSMRRRHPSAGVG